MGVLFASTLFVSTQFVSTQVIDSGDAAAGVVGPDATRGGEQVSSFAELVMAPLSGGLWRHADGALAGWLTEGFSWSHSLAVGRLTVCAELVARLAQATGIAERTAIARTSSAVARYGRLGAGTAHTLVCFAVAICACPATLAAFAAGEVSEEQAKKTLELLAMIPDDDPDSVALSDQIEAVLLARARCCTSARTGLFAEALEEMRNRIDPDGPAPAEDPERNDLSIACTLNGRYRINGDLDAETGEMLAGALSPLAAPRPEDDGTRDRRPAGRRRADALTELLRRYQCGLGPDPDPAGGDPAGGDTADDGDPGRSGAAAGPTAPATGEVLPGGTARPQIHVHIRAQDLTGCGASNDELLDLLRQGRVHEMFTALRSGWTEHHGVLSTATLRRISCDGTVTPIVVDEHGVPLSLGRTVRLANRAQRRALAARDGGCAFPGCTRPVSWTEAHHIIHWADGGCTDLDNLVLLCSAHHRAAHHDGWDIAMGEHRRPVFRPPAGIDPYRRWIDSHGLATADPPLHSGGSSGHNPGGHNPGRHSPGGGQRGSGTGAPGTPGSSGSTTDADPPW